MTHQNLIVCKCLTLKRPSNLSDSVGVSDMSDLEEAETVLHLATTEEPRL